ncbi:MAG TPA: S8 family serine peptidase [Paucimonas sp.]|nr:S8 family serine peptidase [Paucimonas sp.]
MKKKYLASQGLLALCVSAAAFVATGPASAAAPEKKDAASVGTSFSDYTDRLIIKYKDVAKDLKGVTNVPAIRADRMAILHNVGAQHGLTMKALHGIATGANVVALNKKLLAKDVAAIAAKIKAQDPSVEYAEPDYIATPAFVPNDTRYAEQWHYYEPTAGINLPAAWDKSSGTGITVAVIDTGYRPHADLAANIVSGYDFITDAARANDGGGRDSDATDPGDWLAVGECGKDPNGNPIPGWAIDSSWHGTHVAGTIAARTNNSTGVAGVAYNAKILPVRALGKCGGYTSDIADAIIWASGGSVAGVPDNANPAKVLNLSIEAKTACSNTPTYQAAINSAYSRGSAVVVAAGNSKRLTSASSPASCDNTITVAAVNRAGGRAWYSNHDWDGLSSRYIEIAAPGGDTSSSASNGVLSTLNTGTTTPGSDSYVFYQGTSMATPHVAGVAALMLAKNRGLTPNEIKDKLMATARPFPTPCVDPDGIACLLGAGIVNASAAVDAAGGTAISNSPTNLSYGTVNKGYSKTLSVTITNTGAHTANGMSYSAQRTSGTAGAYYRSGGTCSSSLAAGASCTVSVTYEAFCTGGGVAGKLTVSGLNFDTTVTTLGATTNSLGVCP